MEYFHRIVYRVVVCSILCQFCFSKIMSFFLVLFKQYVILEKKVFGLIKNWNALVKTLKRWNYIINPQSLFFRDRDLFQGPKGAEKGEPFLPHTCNKNVPIDKQSSMSQLFITMKQKRSLFTFSYMISLCMSRVTLLSPSPTLAYCRPPTCSF